MRKVMNMTNTSVQKNWQVGVKSLGGKILAKSCTLREENLHPMVKLGEVKHCLKIMIRVKKNDILQLCANGRKRKVFANQVHELCAQLSDSLEKLENQEIAFFDTYSNFWETLIQKLFECFTSCCSSEY